MNLNNLRIGTRLTIGFGAVLALLLVIVGIAYFQLARTNAGVAELDGLERGAAIARNWVSKTQLNVARTVAIAKASGQPDIEKYFSPLIKATSAEISELQKSMEALLTSDEGKSLLAKVASERAAYVALPNQVFEHVKQAMRPPPTRCSRTRCCPRRKPTSRRWRRCRTTRSSSRPPNRAPSAAASAVRAACCWC